MHHLQRVLESTPVITPKERRGNRSPSSSSRRRRSPEARSPKTPSPIPRSPDRNLVWEDSYNTEHCDYSYGAAVGRLRNMLRKHEETIPKTVQFSARVSCFIEKIVLQYCYFALVLNKFPKDDSSQKFVKTTKMCSLKHYAAHFFVLFHR